jgi:hypothetical protein
MVWKTRLLLFAMLTSIACKQRSRIDMHTVTPLVANPRVEITEDAGRRRPPGPSRVPRGVRYIEQRPAPDGALGVRWGMTRAEIQQRNTAETIECRTSREYMFCRRALVPVAVASVVTYEFCGEGLCAVAIDGPRTRDESQMNASFEQLLTMVKNTLGDPSDEARRAGAGCPGHLALCLGSKQAELVARWTWRNGPQVQLSVDQDEQNAFEAVASVTWLSAERARQQETHDEVSSDASVDAEVDVMEGDV